MDLTERRRSKFIGLQFIFPGIIQLLRERQVVTLTYLARTKELEDQFRSEMRFELQRASVSFEETDRGFMFGEKGIIQVGRAVIAGRGYLPTMFVILDQVDDERIVEEARRISPMGLLIQIR